MSVKSCEKLEKSQVALTIEVEAAVFEAAIEKAYRKLRNKINVPGFRPGKAPRKIIEGMYGVEVFFDEAINLAFPDAYEAAVKEKELRTVGYPSVELVGECTRQGFTFKAVAPVYPEVTLGQYQGLSAPKEEVTVTAEDVDRRLQTLTERNTRLVSVEREAKEGDTAVIDFEGFLDGTPFDGGKGENHSLELGSHSFVPGFEEQVVGMKAGDEKDIDITFPEDYHADLAGKAVVFKVKCHEVKEKEVPALDDEFAKDVSEFDTLEELRADLEKQIAGDREKDAQRGFEDALMEQVAGNLTADIPDAMVEGQARQFLENFRSQIAQQGIPYDQYMQMTGMSEAKLLEDAREPALRQVRMDLAVMAIIEAEHIEASEADVEEEYKKLTEQFGMDLEMVKKYVREDQIKDQVCSRRAIDLVVESATATKPEKKEEAPAGEKPARKPRKKKEPEEAGTEEKKPARKPRKKKTEEPAGETKDGE
ncbi:MAG: trigger factor [Oscillibacter sp.]|nr:trigger factor [Oscillibacter sp.]MCI9001460.1 trigger factor [Oscillibacter sp.]